MKEPNITNKMTDWVIIGCIIIAMLFVIIPIYCSSSQEPNSDGVLPKLQEDKIKRDFERYKEYYGNFDYIR